MWLTAAVCEVLSGHETIVLDQKDFNTKHTRQGMEMISLYPSEFLADMRQRSKKKTTRSLPRCAAHDARRQQGKRGTPQWPKPGAQYCLQLNRERERAVGKAWGDRKSGPVRLKAPVGVSWGLVPSSSWTRRRLPAPADTLTIG